MISKLVGVGGRDILMSKGYIRSISLLISLSSNFSSIMIVKALISAGIQHRIGGEFGIGGLFNSCTDDNGDIDHSFNTTSCDKDGGYKWKNLIIPALLEEEIQLLLNDQPILQAAIMSKMPFSIIRHLIDRFQGYMPFQDSSGRYPIDVTVEEGLRWDEGLGTITETFATQQRRNIINVAAQYGIEWNIGMKQVAEENEADIRNVDALTGLYPFILAATGQLRSSSELDSIFNLMKKEPALCEVIYIADDVTDSFSSRYVFSLFLMYSI